MTAPVGGYKADANASANPKVARLELSAFALQAERNAAAGFLQSVSFAQRVSCVVSMLLIANQKHTATAHLNASAPIWSPGGVRTDYIWGQQPATRSTDAT